MKNTSLGGKIYTVLFFCIVLGYAGLSAYQTVPSAVEAVKKMNEAGEYNLKDVISTIDNEIIEDCYERYFFIEEYGKINKLLNKKEINGFEYALDEYGGYNPINFSDDVDNMDYKLVAERILNMKKDAQAHGAKFIYLQSPDKLDAAWNTGIAGIPYEDKNEKTDRLLAWISRYGIDYIDFRETLADSGMSYKEMFYNTDHHWTGVAAFQAYKALVEYMNTTFGQNLDEDGYYTNIENYDISYCDTAYLGSAGRNIGFSYGTCDDYMQLVVPKFDGNITWMKYSGNYKDTVFRYDHLIADNPYKQDAYGFYLYGVAKEDSIKNNSNPNGLRILFVRDSFMSPVIIDMIPFCSQIDCYWGLYVDEATLKVKVAEGNYDYVILSYGTLNIEEENFGFYFREESTEQDEAENQQFEEK